MAINDESASEFGEVVCDYTCILAFKKSWIPSVITKQLARGWLNAQVSNFSLIYVSLKMLT